VRVVVAVVAGLIREIARLPRKPRMFPVRGEEFVTEGRDRGESGCSEAELKVLILMRAQERARRRGAQLRARGRLSLQRNPSTALCPRSARCNAFGSSAGHSTWRSCDRHHRSCRAASGRPDRCRRAGTMNQTRRIFARSRSTSLRMAAGSSHVMFDSESHRTSTFRQLRRRVMLAIPQVISNTVLIGSANVPAAKLSCQSEQLFELHVFSWLIENECVPHRQGEWRRRRAARDDFHRLEGGTHPEDFSRRNAGTLRAK